MSQDFVHFVALPYDRATRLVFYTRSGSVKTFRMIREDILDWLKVNVGKAEFCYHRSQDEYALVKFWFSSKEKAALFKLFWY